MVPQLFSPDSDNTPAKGCKKVGDTPSSPLCTPGPCPRGAGAQAPTLSPVESAPVTYLHPSVLHRACNSPEPEAQSAALKRQGTFIFLHPISLDMLIA